MSEKAIIINTPENTIQSDAQDWASIFNSIIGGKSGVVRYGRNLEAEKVNDNAIKLLVGVYTMQGHIIKIDKDSFVQLVVESGTLGMNRKDAVIVEYIKSTDSTLNDLFEFKIIKGVPKAQGSGQPDLPNVVTQDLHFGGSKRQEIIYEILINDDSIISIKSKTEILESLEKMGSLLSKVENLESLQNTAIYQFSEVVKGFVQGDKVVLTIEGTPGPTRLTANEWTDIGAIPEGYRPIETVYFVPIRFGGYSNGDMGRVGSWGTVQIYTKDNTENYYGGTVVYLK